MVPATFKWDPLRRHLLPRRTSHHSHPFVMASKPVGFSMNCLKPPSSLSLVLTLVTSALCNSLTPFRFSINRCVFSFSLPNFAEFWSQALKRIALTKSKGNSNHMEFNPVFEPKLLLYTLYLYVCGFNYVCVFIRWVYMMQLILSLLLFSKGIATLLSFRCGLFCLRDRVLVGKSWSFLVNN